MADFQVRDCRPVPDIVILSPEHFKKAGSSIGTAGFTGATAG